MTHVKSAWRALVATAVVAATLVVLPGPSADADPVDASTGGAFALALGGSLLGTVIDPTPVARAAFPEAEGIDAEDILTLDLGETALSATGVVEAQAQQDSVITPVSAGLPPANGRGFALIEGLSVLDGLVGAALISSEAVASCQGGQLVTGFDGETADIQVADVGVIGDAVETLLGIIDVDLGLIEIDINRIDEPEDQAELVTVTDSGISVNALELSITLLDEDEPLLELIAGHSEAFVAGCPASTGPPPPQCSDGIDNDGDGKIDFPNDPDCDSPEDDSEFPECSDGIDNDGDGKIDFPADPGCTSPQDDDERDEGGGLLARTGPADGFGPVGLLLMGLAAGGLVLRRRVKT